ncbi:MAG: extracellular solute-binding protein [Bradymonadaceae bacterium]|nr:extracellular solute-binding protein [Lujinxingiaceae bacterium]
MALFFALTSWPIAGQAQAGGEQAGDGAAALNVWHAYRGAEERALQSVVERFNGEQGRLRVKLLSVPNEAFANKLTSAIPRGHGPDVFIAAHERAGDWSRSGLIAALNEDDADWQHYHPVTVKAMEFEGKRYGVPLAYKSLVLFYNPAMIERAPTTTDEMLAIARAHTNASEGRYGLVYEAANFYMHAPWLFGFGGQIFDQDGTLVIDGPGVAASLEFVDQLLNVEGVIPHEATSSLVAHLFNSGHAPMAINGPWFIGELDKSLDYRLAPLPTVSSSGLEASPFLTVEAAFVSAHTSRPQDARQFARYLASHEAALTRAIEGAQPVATLSAYDDSRLADDAHLKVFREQLDRATPMSNDPRMRSVWEPANQALRQVMRGTVAPDLALRQAARRIEIFSRPAPEPKDPRPLAVAVIALLAAALGVGAWRFRRDRVWARMVRTYPAYIYLAPAILGMLVLVMVPFVVGSAVSLFSYREGEFTFVGLANFLDIVMSEEYGLTDPLSFYYTLAVTVLWTSCNVVLHVTLGLFFALLLRDPWMRLRGIYRVMLIVPWAIPNYITALIWKGMFHKQFGAINAFLVWLGAEPVSWFSQFSTSFAANLTTNVWLGFPFMMVVCLGALQAIPGDLEEAASVDGANRWQRFRHVIFPLLKPALIPAVVLGTVWTFNMFNIIYLVSGGEPDGHTEILISEAYKWAFTRQEQYGYAAAYAVLIFFVLLGYSLFTGQLRSRDQ